MASNHEERLINMITTYEKDLIRMSFIYLRDMSLAQDATQETFIKAYKSMDAFRGESSEKTWLMRIAINVCKDMRKNVWYRFVDRRVSLEDVHVASPAYAQPSLENMALSTEIMRLPRKYMEVILLHYFQNMRVKEIVEILEISSPAVSLRLNKARKKLQLALEGGVEDEASLL